MKSEAAAHLAKAGTDLDDARIFIKLPHARAAARSAYYATFHAAEALVTEHTGKAAKTHRGLHVAFSRFTRDLSGEDRALPRVLMDGYRFKELADYGTDPTRVITGAEAQSMIDDATRFVARIAELLSASPSQNA